MKMKKVLSASLMAGILTMGTILPVFASGATTSTSGNTVVSIGIDKNSTAPGQLSVTVPTNLGILLHSPSGTGDSNKVDVYVGGGVKGDTPGEGSGSLSFVNNSKNESGAGQAVEIKSATVSSLGKWAIKEFDSGVTAAYEVGLRLGADQKISAVAAGGSSTTTLTGLTLAAGTGDTTEFVGTTTSIPLSVKVGGQGSNYAKSEATAPAFNVEWRITKQG